jgi:hypothetical protein
VTIDDVRITKSLAVLLCVIFVAGLCNGCGSPTDTSKAVDVKTQPSTVAEPSKPELVAGIPLEQKLVGVWLGEAYVDQSLLERKLQTLSPVRQQEILQRAQTFMTTVMAVDFRADGTMENEGEVIPAGGSPIRLGSQGTWQAIESDQNKLLVAVTEQLADGSFSTTNQLYQFYPDGKQVALTVAMDELSSCNPMIIFTRQNLPSTNVAHQGGTTVK